MVKNVGKCRLCLDKKILIDAHIIPKAFYEIDGKNKNWYVSSSNKYPKTSWEGAYDQNILCGNCDTQIIGKNLDQYAAEVLLQKKI